MDPTARFDPVTEHQIQREVRHYQLYIEEQTGGFNPLVDFLGPDTMTLGELLDAQTSLRLNV